MLSNTRLSLDIANVVCMYKTVIEPKARALTMDIRALLVATEFDIREAYA